MLSILFDWALQPLSMVSLALLLTLISWCIAGAKPLFPFLLFCTSTIMLFTFSMPSFANALVYRLENARQNPAYCENQQEAPMVVLGGGIDLYVPSDSPYEMLKPDSLVRTSRAPEFASESTHYYLLGGGNSERTVAQSMKAVLSNLGIAENNVTTETESKSTYENAQALLKLLPATNGQTITLATSKLHVKRAAATFEKAGYRVCHIEIDTIYSVPKPPVSLLPYLSGLNKTTLAVHEWIALTVYRINGYI